MDLRKWRLSSVLKFVLLIVLFVTVAIDACGETPLATTPKLTINQGIFGVVRFWKGDFQPFDSEKHSSISPVQREVLAYKVITIRDIDPFWSGPFLTQIPGELVGKTSSDASGFYEMSLPPGVYSVIIKEGSNYYINRFGGYGLVNPVQVVPGAVVNLDINIQYQAAF
ncbi:carboxypeptidase-like regulatory domain-containing protein [Geomonas sp. Red32]|uniref:carboxypeptidase-like regulatory domain-containing protein n=1 Tax=Geomonas sp. Red32 TaxID=2912856 RepID=UPI00202CE9F8|nr:carboxypeptidase-like regulatory domain-containing protein [Geomonas sp. Red32]MCM0081131.1 carboxypeptidase-like regulatory domain-containing protein [Geomonas sp. Red32]